MSRAVTDGDPEREVRAIVLLCTAPDVDSGRSLGRRLVEDRLAACVNIVPGVTSIYRWQERVQEDAEQLLVIKTDERRVDAAIALIEQVHPYDCPEAIGLAVTHGSVPYLAWIASSLGSAGD